ncbi:MAG: Ig-like domain-containing protein [Ruminococcus sp.]|nr:Ig-like domain-containing protein [Ruminococcus sp.]
MKLFKQTITIFLSIIIACASMAVASAKENETQTITMKQFTEYFYSVTSKLNCEYSFKVENNKSKAVEVYDYYTNGNYTVCITSHKAVKDTKPAIRIYEKNNGDENLNKTLVVNVKKAKVKNLGTIKVNKGDVSFKFKAGFKYSGGFSCKSGNKKIVKNVSCWTIDDEKNATLSMKAIKNGSARVDIYDYISKQKVAKLKVKVGSFKASVSNAYRKITVKYSKNGQHPFDLYDIVNNPKKGAKYTYKSDSKKLKIRGDYVYAKKTGNAEIKVYEKAKTKKKIGTIKVKMIKATMAETYANNINGDADAFCLNYEDFMEVSNGETTFDLFKDINNTVLNNKFKGTSFSKDEYKITYESEDESVATIDENGLVHAGEKALDKNSVSIRYTISFSDGSSFTDIYYLGIE